MDGTFETRPATKSMYVAAVVGTVGAHFAYLIYLPSGGFLALRWPRSILLHIASVVWGVGVVALGLPCPLTQLEQWTRARAGMDPLPTAGFVQRYIAGVCYPAAATSVAQKLAFLAAVLSWFAFGSKYRRRSHEKPIGSARQTDLS